MSQLLQFVWVEAEKGANNKVGTVLLDTLYFPRPPTSRYSTMCWMRSESPRSELAGIRTPGATWGRSSWCGTQLPKDFEQYIICRTANSPSLVSVTSRDCAACRTSVPGTSASSSSPCSRMVTEASSSDSLDTAPLHTSSMARLPSPDVKLFTAKCCKFNKTCKCHASIQCQCQ